MKRWKDNSNDISGVQPTNQWLSIKLVSAVALNVTTAAFSSVLSGRV